MMRFTKNLKNKCAEVTRFTGANFSSPEAQMSLNAAADLANVYVDALGYIKKRTGYKKMLQSEGNVNGIFCYEYRADGEARKQYFAHIGTNLYFCSLQDDQFILGRCIRTDLQDKKSRSFAFGGALYLLGAGYFKVMWDSAYKMFVCGRVCSAEMDTTQNCLVMYQCVAKDTTFSGQRSAFINADCRYKEVTFEYKNYVFTGSNKLYVAPKAVADKAHVVSVHYQKSDGTSYTLDPMHYQVETDNAGLYVLLNRTNVYFDERIYCTPRIVFTYNNFVYTPTNIINRSPTVLTAYGGSLASGSTQMYDGTLLEGYNLGAPQRAVEFYITSANRAGGTGLCLNLNTRNLPGEILRVYIDGTLQQKYTTNQDGYSESVLFCYGTQYVELESSLLPSTDCIVRVEYVCATDYTYSVADYPMDACNVFGLFGGTNDTRVFLSGNPQAPGRDYASGLYDATYFPDTGYTTVGSDQSAIVGYHKISGYQVILKDGNHFDAAQYLRSYETAADGSAVFTIRQGAQGIGARSVSSFKTCRDHMLFATEDGVYEIKSTDVEAQTNLKCLSSAVNVRLTKQALADAVCAVMDGKYYIAVGTQIYILDTERDMQWYFYKDLPQVLCLYTEGDTLYFGAADGGIYRFMAETEENAYYDNVGINGTLAEARGIHAYWDIPVTTLGCGYKRKSIEDVCIYLAPQPRTGLRVLYTTEFFKDAYRHSENLGRFDFNAVDFADFTFEASDFPVCINTRAKAKRVRVFGARIENAVPGENMILTGFVIKYRENNELK